jgi:hypothetical protein
LSFFKETPRRLGFLGFLSSVSDILQFYQGINNLQKYNLLLDKRKIVRTWLRQDDNSKIAPENRHNFWRNLAKNVRLRQKQDYYN